MRFASASKEFLLHQISGRLAKRHYAFMTPDRRQQVEEIVQTAIELPEAKRESYLCEACGDDDTLLDEVVNLIAVHETGGHHHNQEAKSQQSPDDRDPLLGRRVGAYRIVREVGRGGMGAVYEATRADKEFSKRVAIKLVKRGMDTDFIL